MYVDEKRIGESLVPAVAEARACVDRAIAMLEHGWCQWVPMTRDATAVCVGHAILYSGGPGGSTVYAACQSYLSRNYGTDCPVRWNDAPGRTKDEVISMLLAVRKEM